MKAYKLIEKRFNEEIKSDICYYEHIKSGARVLTVSNDDTNKVFSVAFRTPPTNDTGVPHIMEHSTLCGSKKFPVKDPFVELLKGSLNTFLNAITFPDKTIYPVASCNDKDFANLMEVYLDAVFYPNVYIHPEIFKQEGWHYELESRDGDITYNGVVYNEMKGAFSSPEQVVYRESMHSAFPDSPYGVESGGDPKYIPELSYEEFKAFHKKFYHPSNSYIFLYGNCDMEERLEYMDKEYLSKFDKIDPNSTIAFQKPFDAPHHEEYFYPIGKDESIENKTYYVYNAVIGKAGDNLLNTAFNIITYVLFEAPGAPLKQALLDANIGKDIISSYESGILQPLFSVGSKDAPSGKVKEFEELIRSEFTKVVKEGIDKSSILAAINFMEFQTRESDFQGSPKGLVYNLTTLDNWLYDDNDPFSKLEPLKVFKELREKVNTTYFEDLIKQYILDNNHVSVVTISPSNTLGEENDQATKKILADYKASLSDEELDKLIEDTKALKLYQATPSTPKELATLPKLTRNDINDDVMPFKNDVSKVFGVEVVKHNIFTNGITYLRVGFDALNVSNEYLPYLGLLSSVLKYVSTDKYSYQELSKQILTHTGGIEVGLGTYFKNINDVNAKLFITAKYLPGEEGFVFDTFKEILLHSHFDDKKRIREIVEQEKSQRQGRIMGAGHMVATSRALSYVAPAGLYDELTDGLEFYSFIEDLAANFDEKIDGVIAKFKELCSALFVKEGMIISATCESDEYLSCLPDFIESLNKNKNDLGKFEFVANDKKEAFKSSSTVQFNGEVCVYDGLSKYRGALQVFGMALRYDYLWNRIRVLGGAYGAMARFTNKGYIQFVSYRDPKLKETYKVYDEVIDFIDNMNYSDQDVTNFIIGAIGAIDSPLTPRQEGARSFGAYILGTDINDLIKERKEIINTTLEDLKGLREFFVSAFKNKYICTVGNENKVEECKDIFKEVKPLFK